jgi:hypothetical protein
VTLRDRIISGFQRMVCRLVPHRMVWTRNDPPHLDYVQLELSCMRCHVHLWTLRYARTAIIMRPFGVDSVARTMRRDMLHAEEKTTARWRSLFV